MTYFPCEDSYRCDGCQRRERADEYDENYAPAGWVVDQFGRDLCPTCDPTG
jgi:hypothetical protein